MKYIECMHGIGDTIYQRPFLRSLLNQGEDVFIDTSIPQLYNDLPLKFVRPNVEWRTQAKNLTRVDDIQWTNIPDIEPKDKINPHYDAERLVKKSLIHCMEDSFNVSFENDLFDLPDYLDPHPVNLPANKPIAIIKPATIRKEWEVSSRNPDPRYLLWCSQILRQSGYHVISIADTQEGHEWAVGPLPESDQRFLCGELNIPQVIDLVRDADLVIGGSGWIVPAAMAARTPLFIVFGGRGSFDSPWKILDMRMDLTKVGWAMPDKFCRCANNNHSCNKKITDLDHQFFSFIKQLQQERKYDAISKQLPKGLFKKRST